MTLTTLEQEILAQLHTLTSPQQRAVLAFVRTLSATPVGVPGKTLLELTGAIDSHDLTALKQAIDEGCEQVNLDEWFEYRLEHDPRFLKRIEAARASVRAKRGIRLEDLHEEE